MEISVWICAIIRVGVTSATEVVAMNKTVLFVHLQPGHWKIIAAAIQSCENRNASQHDGGTRTVKLSFGEIGEDVVSTEPVTFSWIPIEEEPYEDTVVRKFWDRVLHGELLGLLNKFEGDHLPVDGLLIRLHVCSSTEDVASFPLFFWIYNEDIVTKLMHIGTMELAERAGVRRATVQDWCRKFQYNDIFRDKLRSRFGVLEIVKSPAHTWEILVEIGM